MDYCDGARKHDKASVRIPTPEKVDEYKQLVRNKHEFLTNVWCTMDGLKLTLEQSGDARFKRGFIMVGHMTIMFLRCFVSARMVQSLLLLSIVRVLFMTVRLPNMAIYTTNCSMSTKGMAQNALWTLRSVMLHANI